MLVGVLFCQPLLEEIAESEGNLVRMSLSHLLFLAAQYQFPLPKSTLFLFVASFLPRYSLNGSDQDSGACWLVGREVA